MFLQQLRLLQGNPRFIPISLGVDAWREGALVQVLAAGLAAHMDGILISIRNLFELLEAQVAIDFRIPLHFFAVGRGSSNGQWQHEFSD